MRYSRAVIRRALDKYLFAGCSHRIVAQVLRSEINGTERASVWDPEGLVWPTLPQSKQVRLCHISVWRWLQEAGRRANKEEDRFSRICQSGIWVADSILAKVKGVWLGVLGVADAVSRVVFEIVRTKAESEEEVLRTFARLRSLGVKTKKMEELVSDGAEAYRLLIEGVMKRTAHQRCVFHPIRTQLRAGWLRTWTTQRDDVANFQRIISNDNPFDQHLQDGLLLHNPWIHYPVFNWRVKS